MSPRAVCDRPSANCSSAEFGSSLRRGLQLGERFFALALLRRAAVPSAGGSAHPSDPSAAARRRLCVRHRSLRASRRPVRGADRRQLAVRSPAAQLLELRDRVGRAVSQEIEIGERERRRAGRGEGLDERLGPIGSVRRDVEHRQRAVGDGVSGVRASSAACRERLRVRRACLRPSSGSPARDVRGPISGPAPRSA